MGSGVSREYIPPASLEEASNLALKEKCADDINIKNKSKENAMEVEQNAETTAKLLGKGKYIKEFGTLTMDYRPHNSETQGTLLLFCAKQSEKLTFVYYEHKTGNIYEKSFTDAELAETKNSFGIRFSWAPFFKSLASAMLKSKVEITIIRSPNANSETEKSKLTNFPASKTVVIGFTITDKRDATHSYPFTVQLNQLVNHSAHSSCSSSSSSSNSSASTRLHSSVIEPLIRAMQYNFQHDKQKLNAQANEQSNHDNMAKITTSNRIHNDTTTTTTTTSNNNKESNVGKSHSSANANAMNAVNVCDESKRSSAECNVVNTSSNTSATVTKTSTTNNVASNSTTLHKAINMDAREVAVSSIASEMAVYAASIAKCQRTVNRLLPLIRPLREEAAVHSNEAMAAAREVRELERVLRVNKGQTLRKHPLDALYDEGGAQFFKHSPYAVVHYPHEEEPDEILTACIRAAFPLPDGVPLSSISQVFSRPELKSKIDLSGRQRVIIEAFEIFKGIDQWDYDVIQLEIITNGQALFYTTYTLMYKLNLVSHFNIDDKVLCNFLSAVQAAYHPNPYHNAMHGADVTQINYYIMNIAGLIQKCKLSKEEILAGLLAGAVHDYDHPGLNNSFHTRTNAFLATLYNDRSILENHHIASTYELLRKPKYNIFATLSEAQRQVVRDTMVEMVLATDMGLHNTIFKNFQVRLSETSDWASKKKDVLLALSISIKMADVSNCARPNHIYAEWAKNITREFYRQGDLEKELNLAITPFMDRGKAEDFPKGQISFMMYIVQPMLEAISELLPAMRFTIALCNENKEYWKRITDQKSESNAAV